MQMDDTLIRYGTDAVSTYGAMSGITAETFIPEQCLGVFLASRLVDELGLDARREDSYIGMLEQRYRSDPEIKNVLGGLHADVAIYENGRLTAVIEIKKVEKMKHVREVKRDAEKLHKLAERVSVACYLGLAIFEDNSVMLEQQIKRLEQAIGRSIRVGAKQQGHTARQLADWHWCFGCVALQANN